MENTKEKDKEILQEKWGELSDKCHNCVKCELFKTRTKIVFGKGSTDAKILFVGEAPGENEDKEGVPFVGRAGKLLDRYFEVVDFNLENIYVTNIVKCRPPKNRDPNDEETNCCINYLREQTRLLEPKIIVCLGRISATKIIKPDFKITQERGKWFFKNGIHMMAIFHPSALLRDATRKADTLLDLKAVHEKAIELEIIRK